ncbi:hypothetical protein HDV06_006447 [Boothiomyces sp. JEL0866]|nr:hypothetical protein HDV06_001228 [Boothiomyces sp. JEL0866]KAJ3324554.1 hypothetical protein HDV06_006447 [Boothiomyces sp. JEL0866]
MAFIVAGKRISQRLALAFGALIYFALIIVCTVINGQSFSNRQMSGIDELNSNSINVTNQILSFSPTLLNLVVVSTVQAVVNNTMVVNGKATNFTNPGVFLQQVSSTIPVSDAQSVAYPFDTYKTLVSQMVKDLKTQQAVPYSYLFSGTIDLWRSDIEPLTTDVDNERVFIVTLKRTTITILFSIFLYLIMWVLSSAAFIVTLSIWTRGRKVEPPTIAAVGAILFALPTIRNAQPGAPPVGCNADILAFFPCMLLVTASVFMGLTNYLVVYKANKEKSN